MSVPPAHATQGFVAECISSMHDLTLSHGHSATVYDTDNRRYVDLTGGLGVLVVGHSHPRVAEAIAHQATRLIHASYPTNRFAGYEQISAWLSARFVRDDRPYQSALFNSGAEAIDNAMKIANWVTGRTSFLAVRGAFHGRTAGALALTHKGAPYKAGLTMNMPRAFHLKAVRFEDEMAKPDHSDVAVDSALILDEIEIELDRGGIDRRSLAAVFYEPILGEGGIRRLSHASLSALHRLARRHGALLVADEIQTGCGRTGAWFPSWIAGLEPDIVVSGKALGGGLPLSAVSAGPNIFASLHKGGLGGTMAGNAIACAAGLATLAIIDKEDLRSRAPDIERAFRNTFAHREACPVAGLHVRLRAYGAMLAFEFIAAPDSRVEPQEMVRAILSIARESGVLALRGGESGNVLRLLPPLNIAPAEIDEGFTTLDAAFSAAETRF